MPLPTPAIINRRNDNVRGTNMLCRTSRRPSCSGLKSPPISMKWKKVLNGSLFRMCFYYPRLHDRSLVMLPLKSLKRMRNLTDKNNKRPYTLLLHLHREELENDLFLFSVFHWYQLAPSLTNRALIETAVE